MAQFKEDSFGASVQMQTERGSKNKKIIGLRVLCIVIRKAQRFWDFKAFNRVE